MILRKTVTGFVIALLGATATITTISCSADGVRVVEIKGKGGKLVETYQQRRSDGARHGWYRGYTPEGNLLEEAHYADDFLDGERKVYHPNGNLQILEHYREGLLEGNYQVFYESGKLKLQATFVRSDTASTMEGDLLGYYESGQLKEKVTMLGNMENGAFEEYHSNGKIWYKGTYKNGDREQGLLEEFDENGELVRKANCDNGVCNTIWRRDSSEVQR